MIQTFDELRGKLIALLSDVKDEDTGENLAVDVNDPNDVIAVLVNVLATALTQYNFDLLKYRTSLNPAQATGEELRNVMQYKGLTAKLGEKTSTVVTFSGSEGIIIPIGTVLTDETGSKKYETTQNAVIPESGTVKVSAECERVGANVLDVNELVKLLTPIFGVQIEGNTLGELGQDAETDDEIHLRLETATGANGMGFLDVLDSALNNLPGVKSASTYIHSSFAPFDAIPAGAICSVVRGGEDKDIAEVLFNKNLFFFDYYGNVSFDVVSTYLGRKYTVKFQRPKETNASIKIAVVDTGALPDTLEKEFYEAAAVYVASKSPNSTIYLSDLVYFLNKKELGTVVRAAICKGDTPPSKYDATTDSLKIEWDEVITLPSSNFTMEKIK